MESSSSTSRSNGPGRGTAIAIIIAVAVVMGALTGWLGATFKVSFVILWVVIAPTVGLLARVLLAKGSAEHADGSALVGQTLLLDAEVKGRRLAQVALPLAATPILVLGFVIGVSDYIRRDPVEGAWTAAAVLLGVGALLMIAALFYSIGWDVSYKGHQIRFENHPCFGERLLIDGTQVDRGSIGVHMTLRGTIAGGAGAGEQITATSRAGLTAFSCRIVAESLATAPR